jgi:ABC-2 type transport system ATP-binding protein
VTSGSAASLVLVAREVCKTFRTPLGQEVRALNQVSFEIPSGTLTALVGPDGAGKTTLMRLATGLLPVDTGEVRVLGADVAVDPAEVQARVAYMPQRFGLYEDLSVRSNLALYADLHGVTEPMRQRRVDELLELTALAPFVSRLAGQLSGGMKQKLAVACTLIHSPELLLLDEPTVGVDPLSRRELWHLILNLVKSRGLSVLISTSYLDEAERCDYTVVLHEGRVLVQGPPDIVRDVAAGRVFVAEPAPGTAARTLQARLLDTPAIVDAVPQGGFVRFSRQYDDPSALSSLDADGTREPIRVRPTPARFEDGFMALLRRAALQDGHIARVVSFERPLSRRSGEEVVRVDDLVRQFGAFTAVDHVSFRVRAGEIFGLLGPNGAGKTTTFRMLCGLLAATGGTLRVAGEDLRTAAASARKRIGYVAQKFSLYGPLTVLENLTFFASAYGVAGERGRRRIDWALEQFELRPHQDTPAEQLPGGFKRRLAMAAALLHEPETLFLDEPTSGADPLARREFWRSITALADQGVTVVVTTHFMEEAEYCDHVAILDQGRIVAKGTPAQIRSRGSAEEGSMEDAFIAIVESGRSSSPLKAADAGGPL